MSEKPFVYVLDPYHEDAISLLENSTNLITPILPHDPRKSFWHTNATAILLRSETTVTRTDLSLAKNLKIIVKQGVGVNNIDLAAAKDHGVIVCNTPALNSEAVAELTISLALSVARRLCEFDRRIRGGEKVVRSQMLGRSLWGKTIGVVGMGNIGIVVARKWAAAMEGEVIAFDPYAAKDVWDNVSHRRVDELEELLRVADVVTLHVPLTEGTKGMIGKKELRLMKNNAILVNCARGGVVEEAALLEVLKAKGIFGAALDAMDVEPPTLEAYGQGLLSCSNVIMTPHIGASTIENQSKSGVAVVETLLAVLRGENPPNRLV